MSKTVIGGALGFAAGVATGYGLSKVPPPFDKLEIIGDRAKITITNTDSTRVYLFCDIGSVEHGGQSFRTSFNFPGLLYPSDKKTLWIELEELRHYAQLVLGVPPLHVIHFQIEPTEMTNPELFLPGWGTAYNPVTGQWLITPRFGRSWVTELHWKSNALPLEMTP